MALVQRRMPMQAKYEGHANHTPVPRKLHYEDINSCGVLSYNSANMYM